MNYRGNRCRFIAANWKRWVCVVGIGVGVDVETENDHRETTSFDLASLLLLSFLVTRVPIETCN